MGANLTDIFRRNVGMSLHDVLSIVGPFALNI